MKIERLNDNQIRCILNFADLRERHVNLPELAYGSDKAKKLFGEMMELAYREAGFEADGMPLMIEATPMPGDNLVLLITKIEDPEELDTRFARFAPSLLAGSVSRSDFESMAEGIGDLLKALDDLPVTEDGGDGAASDSFRTFIFKDMQHIKAAAQVILPLYHGRNNLYYREGSKTYYLTAHRGRHTAEEFARICNILTEFGQQLKTGFSSESYYQEHFTSVYRGGALKKVLAK